jgi:hypothetical protein
VGFSLAEVCRRLGIEHFEYQRTGRCVGLNHFKFNVCCSQYVLKQCMLKSMYVEVECAASIVKNRIFEEASFVENRVRIGESESLLMILIACPKFR